ncbi:meteorin-like protein [Cloeon dipterum]|uniref:meteorin-like protein n=1 Tax=Cloeon dipterum TaxID=197152 RepID=UPI0032208EF8
MALCCKYLHHSWRLSTVNAVVFFVILASLAATTASQNVITQECDWTGSGSSGASDREVTPVYLRCTQGRVNWKLPRGAIRVVLRLPSPVSSVAPFRACVRPLKGGGGATIWLEKGGSLKKMFREVRVQKGSPQSYKCAQSQNGQVVLFVDTVAGAPERDLSFLYHLEQLPLNGVYNPENECKPCTMEEMAKAFCTSDFVARGRIVRTYQNNALKQTTLLVQVTKSLRSLQDDPTLSDEEIENVIPAPLDENKVHLVIGQHCGAHQGEGEFVFMARRKLGDLTLTCAPTLGEWIRVSKRLNRKDSTECILTV